MENSILKVKIKALPIDGKANKDCIAYLAKRFNVPKHSIEIIRGQSIKNKRIRFKTLKPEFDINTVLTQIYPTI